jgi:hypothetical protein
MVVVISSALVSLHGDRLKIFAPGIEVNEINRLRGAEIRCIKVRYPPQAGIPEKPLGEWRRGGRIAGELQEPPRGKAVQSAAWRCWAKRGTIAGQKPAAVVDLFLESEKVRMIWIAHVGFGKGTRAQRLSGAGAQ